MASSLMRPIIRSSMASMPRTKDLTKSVATSGIGLNRVGSLAQNVGDRIDQQPDELIFDLRDDDDMALGGPRSAES